MCILFKVTVVYSLARFCYLFFFSSFCPCCKKANEKLVSAKIYKKLIDWFNCGTSGESLDKMWYTWMNEWNSPIFFHHNNITKLLLLKSSKWQKNNNNNNRLGLHQLLRTLVNLGCAIAYNNFSGKFVSFS